MWFVIIFLELKSSLKTIITILKIYDTKIPKLEEVGILAFKGLKVFRIK